jgi:hypothetical protein
LGPTGRASEQLEEEREFLRSLMAQMEIGDEQDRHSSAFKDFVMYILSRLWTGLGKLNDQKLTFERAIIEGIGLLWRQAQAMAEFGIAGKNRRPPAGKVMREGIAEIRIEPR